MTRYLKVTRTKSAGSSYSAAEIQMFVGYLSADGQSVELLYEDTTTVSNPAAGHIDSLLTKLRATEV